MKLISMTDFVLHESFGVGNEIINKVIFYNKCSNYAQFLKQSLKLEMFVPCDDNGSVLSEPKCNHSFDIHGEVVLHHEGCNIKDWNKSKEKVLFEGFESVDTRNKDRFQVRLQKANISGSCDTIQNDFAGFYFHDSRNEKSRVKIIEDLLKFHPLELTQNAIKQLGL